MRRAREKEKRIECTRSSVRVLDNRVHWPFVSPYSTGRSTWKTHRHKYLPRHEQRARMIQSFGSPSYSNSEARAYFRSQSRISYERRRVTYPVFNVIDQPPGKHHVHKHSFVRACNRQRKTGQHRCAMTPKRQRIPQTARRALVDVHVPTSLQHAHRPAFHSFSKAHTLPVGCVRTVLQRQRHTLSQANLVTDPSQRLHHDKSVVRSNV